MKEQSPKKPNHHRYQNVFMQNEWIKGNVFDAIGNYFFCHTCIVKGSSYQSTALVETKEGQAEPVFQRPILRMTKDEVDKGKVDAFVVMPESVETSFTVWWTDLPGEHLVDVCYPHEKLGLAGSVEQCQA